MKIVSKILKIVAVLLAIALLAVAFWIGIFNASGNPDLPVPYPVGLLEPPDFSVSSHLYDTTVTEIGGETYENALGFPLYGKEAYLDSGVFDFRNAVGYDNRLEDGSNYNIDKMLADEDTSALDLAFYLFRIASYNEVMATNYAFFQESGGTADISGVNGKLMSQAIKWSKKNFENDSGKFTENFFYQQVNALIDIDASQLIQQAAGILKRAERKMVYNNDRYEFKDALGATYVKYDDASPDVQDYYQPFLAPGSGTVAAGRGTADWASKIAQCQREDANQLDLDGKYVGIFNRKLTDAEVKAGYKTFSDVFEMKFILNLKREMLYDEDAENEELKPSVKKVYVDGYGNATDEEGKEYTENSPEAVRFYYDCVMSAKVDVVNADPKSIEALKDYTKANPASFTKLTYRFSVWDSGLMRHWHTVEGWAGEYYILDGLAYPNNPSYYSYRADATVIEDYVKFLIGESRAESVYGITYPDGVTTVDGVALHNPAEDKNYFDKTRVKALFPTT